MENRYHRQQLLPEIGDIGQRKFRQSKVLIVGCGGLGVPVIQILAGAGIGTLGLCDFDTVSLTNLHRQPIYPEAGVGKPKTQQAAEYIRQFNSEINVHIHDGLATETGKKITTNYNLVVDCSDNFATRYLVNDLCVALNKPWVSGALNTNESQIATFNWKGSGTYRCLYPEAPENAPKCSTEGVWPALPAFAGSLMAWEVLDLILGKPKYVNQLRIDQPARGSQMILGFEKSSVNIPEKIVAKAKGISLEQAKLLPDSNLIWIGDPLIPESLMGIKVVPGFEDPMEAIENVTSKRVILACLNGVLSKNYAFSNRIQGLHPDKEFFFIEETFTEG